MKIAVCGLWHVHAVRYYKEAAKYAEIVGAWDDDPDRLRQFCRQNGVPEFQSFEQLLQCGADAAIVATSTDTHTEVIVKLAEAGMDIFAEKVLALTTAECEKIEAAVKKSGVRFVISFPKKFIGGVRAVKAMVDSGELGRINYFRYRNVHNGSLADWLPAHFYNRKQCGGGAMIDLGAHGMYLAEWLLGMPESAKSVFTVSYDNPRNSDRVEDNAVTVLRYADGAIAVNETGFVSRKYPETLEVNGELGWARFDGKQLVKCTVESDVPVVVPVEDNLPLPITQFCQGLVPEGCGMTEAKNLTKLMEMAYDA